MAMALERCTSFGDSVGIGSLAKRPSRGGFGFRVSDLGFLWVPKPANPEL